MFLLVRAVNRLQKKEEARPAALPEPSAEIKLLTDIRNLLQKQRA